MITPSLSSTHGLIKENFRYSLPSVTPMVSRVHYSRHLSLKPGTRSSNRKPRKIIHVTIRSPNDNRRSGENKSAHPTLDLRSVKNLFYYLIEFLFIVLH
jgi:hypothetical protein